MILDDGYEPPAPPSFTTIVLTGRPPVKIKDSEWKVLGEFDDEMSSMTVRKFRGLGEQEYCIISGHVGSVHGGNIVCLGATGDRWSALFVEMKAVAVALGNPLLAQSCIEKFEALPFT